MKSILFFILQLFAFSLFGQTTTAKNIKLINAALDKIIKSNSITYQLTLSSSNNLPADKNPISAHYKVFIEKRKDKPMPKVLIEAKHWHTLQVYYLDTLQSLIDHKIKSILIDSVHTVPESGHINIMPHISCALPLPYWRAGYCKEMLTADYLVLSYIDSLHYLNIRVQEKEENSYVIYSINRKTKNFEKYSIVSKNNGIEQTAIYQFYNISFNSVKEKDFQDYINLPQHNYYITLAYAREKITPLAVEAIAPKISGFYFPNYEGKAIELPYKKVTILNFWFANCAPCIQTMPFLNALKEKYGDRIDIIGINPSELHPNNKVLIDKFLEKTKANFPVFLSKGSDAAFHLTAYPSIYIVDENGKIIYISKAEDMAYKEAIRTFLAQYFKGK